MNTSDEIKELVLTAIITGETFYKNGLNETYLTREMFGQFLELHKITDEEFDTAISELIAGGIVYIEDDVYYRIKK